MGFDPLQQAPPTLFKLFPKSPTLDEKAFKFLEVKYELMTDRRVAKELKIDPKTVKNINEFLLNTEVGQRFNALLAEQTEDFYSAKTLVSLYEGFRKEIDRIEVMITREQNDERKRKLISEKRMWMGKLLDASIQLRPLAKGANTERKKDEAKQLSKERESLLDDYDPILSNSPDTGDNLN
jgi:hypothetical protein